MCHLLYKWRCHFRLILPNKLAYTCHFPIGKYQSLNADCMHYTQLLVEIYSLKYHLNAADISKDQIMQSVEYMQISKIYANLK